VTGTRSKKIARKTGINIVPILIFVGVAVVLTAGLYAYDVQYRRAEEARRRPPEPEAIARNLVENIVGAGTVKEVTFDRDRKAITVTFESALFRPDRPRAEMRELLEAEATLATQAVLTQMRDIEKVVARLVAQGRVLAVAEMARGRDRPAVTFEDPRVRD
jgi:hypothetical protein